MTTKPEQLLELLSQVMMNPKLQFAVRTQSIWQTRPGHDRKMGPRAMMRVLWQGDGLTNAELAEKLDIRPSSVTAQVKHLEEKGLVLREQDQEDKRVSRVVLTNKGHELKGKREKSKHDLTQELFSVLSEQEQDQLYDLLVKLVSHNQVSDQEVMGFEQRHLEALYMHDLSRLEKLKGLRNRIR